VTPSRALVDDLPLFAVPSRAAAEAAPSSEALHPDKMSPREALEALYALNGKLPKGG
jgi:DNA mismatch repair protein MutS